jgi:hypothetical protein
MQFGFMTVEGAEDRCYGTPGFESVERCLERCLDAEQPSNIQATLTVLDFMLPRIFQTLF